MFYCSASYLGLKEGYWRVTCCHSCFFMLHRADSRKTYFFSYIDVPWTSLVIEFLNLKMKWFAHVSACVANWKPHRLERDFCSPIHPIQWEAEPPNSQTLTKGMQVCLKPLSKCLWTVVVSNIFFSFTPIWGRFPIWLIFLRLGWNHQPVYQ